MTTKQQEKLTTIIITQCDMINKNNNYQQQQ